MFAPSGGPATDPIGERYSRLVAAGEIDPVAAPDVGPTGSPFGEKTSFKGWGDLSCSSDSSPDDDDDSAPDGEGGSVPDPVASASSLDDALSAALPVMPLIGDVGSKNDDEGDQKLPALPIRHALVETFLRKPFLECPLSQRDACAKALAGIAGVGGSPNSPAASVGQAVLPGTVEQAGPPRKRRRTL